MSKISDRADAFAKRLVKPTAPPDERSDDEKTAAFIKFYSTGEYLKDAKAKMKESHASKYTTA